MIFRCQVFPHPALNDTYGPSANERIEGLRQAFDSICEFLESDQGLKAIPSSPLSPGETSRSYTIDPILTAARTGIRGATELMVRYAVDGEALGTAAWDQESVDALSPLLAVRFNVNDAWRIGMAEMPFYDDLASAMQVPWVVCGYEVEYQPGDELCGM